MVGMRRAESRARQAARGTEQWSFAILLLRAERGWQASFPFVRSMNLDSNSNLLCASLEISSSAQKAEKLRVPL